MTTRLDDDLAQRLDAIAKKERLDRSAVVRRFLAQSIDDYEIERALEDYSAGRISLWMAAERCGVSLWEMIDEAERRQTVAPYGSEELKQDLEGLASE